MKKKLSRVFAVVLALVMVMGISTMAFADDGVNGDGSTAITSVNVTVEVKTDGNTYQPNTKFGLTVSPFDSNSTYTDAGNTSGTAEVVYAGIEGGLKFTEGSEADFTYSDASSLSVSGTYTRTTTLTVDSSKFNHTGIYGYTVTEPSVSYDGLTCDTTSYNVYLYVYQDSDGKYYVGYVVSTTTVNEVETKTDLLFTNDYGYDSSKGTDTDGSTSGSTHDVKISKTVDGNMADTNKEFTFTVKVTSSESGTDEAYKIVVKETSTSDASTTQTYMTSGDTGVKVTLKATGSIQIYGLSENDIVTVTETDYSSDGYTTTTSENGITDTNNETLIVAGSVTTDGATIEYTNTKNATTPTGLIMTYGPYALIVVIAVAAGLVFFFRRRRTTF